MRNKLRVAVIATMLALDSLAARQSPAHGTLLNVTRSADTLSWEEALEASRIALMGQETWDSLAA